MKALEAFAKAKLREQYGITLAAIEKEANKGKFELDVAYIWKGEVPYYMDEEEMNFLRRLGYKIIINESKFDFDGDQQIISWRLDE